MANKLLQVFRAGNYGTGLVFSEWDVQCIAAGYNKNTLRAPLVLGHPKNNLPEYGEVDALFVEGGALFAQAKVSDTLVDWVRRKLYKNVSASFFCPDSPGNPTPGAYYLNHVGFLGAHPPAVKGMAALNFADISFSVDFAENYEIQATHGLVVPMGYQIAPLGQTILNLAKDYQRVCTSMSFAEAVQRAENILIP